MRWGIETRTGHPCRWVPSQRVERQVLGMLVVASENIAPMQL